MKALEWGITFGIVFAVTFAIAGMIFNGKKKNKYRHSGGEPKAEHTEEDPTELQKQNDDFTVINTNVLSNM